MFGRRRILRSLLVLGSISLLVTVYFVGRSYLQLRSAGPDLAALLNKPSVEITSPGAKASFEIGEAIEVEVSSIAQTSLIASTELQIDGVTAEVHAAPSVGLSLFSTVFAFAAGKPGSHTLLAKSVDDLGFAAYSNPVQIEIVENTGAEQAPFFSGNSSAIVLGSGQPLANQPQAPPPDQENSPPPADIWSISVGDWLSPPDSNQALTPPELDARVEKCKVELFIQDFSDHEQGFAVFRQEELIPGWVRIATLSPIPGSLKSFADEDPPDGPANVSYYVEAFNKYHAAPSNVAQVTITPDPDCATSYAGPPGFSVEMDSLTIRQPVDSAYCYRSFDGTSWHRWPATGFFTPGEGGAIDTSSAPLVFFSEDFDGGKLSTELSVSLDCWGWQDGAFIPLGKFTRSGIDPSVYQTYLADSGDILPKINVKKLEYLPKFSPANLPFYSVRMTFDPNECFNHIIPYKSPEANNACAVKPGYHLGPEGIAPQPYVVWDVEDLKCEAGSGPLACIKWQKWIEWWAKFQLSGLNERMIWVLTDTHGPSVIIDNPMRMAYAPPPPDRECKTTRAFLLNLYVDTLATFQGPVVFTTIPCNAVKPLPDSGVVDVAVSFHRLVLNSVDDGPFDHDIETSGSIIAYLECVGYTGTPGTRCFDNNNNEVPSSELVHGLAALEGTVWYPVHYMKIFGHLGNGTYPLADRPLLDITDQNLVSPTTILKLPTNFGQRMVITFFLLDYDDLSKDDVACDSTAVIGSSGPDDVDWWPTRDNYHVSIQSPDNGTAACWLDVYISAVELK